MFSGFRKIKQINTFHAIIILSIIYTEKWLSSNRLSVISVLVKIFRKFIVQGMYHCDIHPDSFASLDAISTCRMPHPYLIVVHQTARIQDNAVIFHNVTIGVIEDGSAPHAAQLGKMYISGSEQVYWVI